MLSAGRELLRLMEDMAQGMDDEAVSAAVGDYLRDERGWTAPAARATVVWVIKHILEEESGGG